MTARKPHWWLAMVALVIVASACDPEKAFAPDRAPASVPSVLKSAAASGGLNRNCPSALPETMPSDLVIGIRRTRVPKGKETAVFATEMTAQPDRCANAERCVAMDEARLGSLWSRFRGAKFGGMRTARTQGKPHDANHSLWLKWGDHRCEVVDGQLRKITGEADRTAFFSLHERVWQLAAHAHLGVDVTPPLP